MADTYAAGRATLPRPGVCTWMWLWEDVRLRCRDLVMPGESLCADHFIEHVHSINPASSG